jgi:hypothetical protein
MRGNRNVLLALILNEVDLHLGVVRGQLEQTKGSSPYLQIVNKIKDNLF